MLTKAEKSAIIDGLRANIEKAEAIFLTNLIGIGSNDAVALRKKIREAGGSVVVTRNTLFAKAAEGTVAEDMLKDLKGPQALAFAFNEAPAVAKCLKEAGKDHEVIELRGGIFEGKVISINEAMALADLPSRDEMLGTLLATFNAPISALARVMHAIGEKKAEGGGPVEATAAVEEVPAE